MSTWIDLSVITNCPGMIFFWSKVTKKAKNLNVAGFADSVSNNVEQLTCWPKAS